MSAGAFDTNILVYAVTAGPKGDAARALLAQGGLLPVQAINEFTNVAVRKLGLSWSEIGEAVAGFIALCGDPLPLTYGVHANGRALAERYQLSFYDALMVAAALAEGCSTLYSEDMHHGLVIEERLTVINPFADGI